MARGYGHLTGVAETGGQGEPDGLEVPGDAESLGKVFKGTGFEFFQGKLAEGEVVFDLQEDLPAMAPGGYQDVEGVLPCREAKTDGPVGGWLTGSQ